MASLTGLKATRGGNRGVNTRLMNKIQEILDDNSITRDRKIHELGKKLKELHDKIKTVEGLDREILENLSDQEIEDEVTNSYNINAVVYDFRDKAEYELGRLRKEKDDENVTAQAAVVAANAPIIPQPNITVNAPTDSSLLPKFTLPEFNGNLLLWSAFWDVFEIEVDQKNKYSGATKFNFLNSRLSGEAKALLQGLVPTNDNYPVAIDLLKKRFGQPKKIIMAHMRALVALVKPTMDRVGLRKFVDSLESHIRGLGALKKTTDTYGDLLVCILLDKMPADLRRNLARQTGAVDWDLDSLRAALVKEIEIMEDCNELLQRSGPKGPKQATVAFAGSNEPRNSNTRSSEYRSETKPCAFCDATNHWPHECTTVTSAVDRYRIVSEKKLCFNCLSPKHRSNSCPSRKRCRTCHRAHHTSLHQERESGQPTTVVAITSNAVPTTILTMTSTSKKEDSFVFLETAVVETVVDGEQAKVNVLVDKCGQRTFVTTHTAKLFNLKPKWRELLILNGFISGSSSPEYYDVVQLVLPTKNGPPLVLHAIVVDLIVQPLSDPHREAMTKLPHLKNLNLAHSKTSGGHFRVDVLIGADFYWSLVGNHIVKGSGPTATSSRLGYLISGRFDGSFGADHVNVLSLGVTCEEKIDVTRFWQLETLGIQTEIEADNVSKNYQKDSITFRDGRYVARLPWKSNHPVLTSNLVTCEKRTKGTVRRLAIKGQKYLAAYHNIILEQEKRGIIELVPTDQLYRSCHYVPHFGVIKDSPTTPLRVVYDCSCKTPEGISLNDCLDIGPPLQNDMLHILLRFRLHIIALSADIEKAFHQVGLDELDRDFLRFLWPRNPENPDSELTVYRFRVIPFGASSSPFILLSAIKKHLDLNPSQIADDINKNLYVDNLISGCSTLEQAKNYFTQSNAILGKGNFKLQVWGSNNSEIEKQANSNNIGQTTPSTKLLGLTWNRVDDTLQLPISSLSEFCKSIVTKRDILRGVSHVYDPLGWITPLTIPARILIQEIWKTKFQWDDVLPDHLANNWRSVAADIQKASVKIPRRHPLITPSILHVFVDASQSAYGAVSYLGDKKTTSFVLSRSRVSPLRGGKKMLTLPQLELMAAVIGVKLAETILAALQALVKGLEVIMWSDSQIVLHWISKMDKIKCQFVSNRVATIRDFNNRTKAVWRYCPTACNPADLLSRGITLLQFNKSTIWNTGPAWINDRESWPSWEGNVEQIAVFHLAAITEQPTPLKSASTGVHKILDPTRYKWAYLMRTTAVLVRFAKNIENKNRSNWTRGFIKPAELTEAENLWIKSTQAEHFKSEIDYLTNPKTRRPSLVSQLDLFLDEQGLLRCRGRLQHAKIPRDTKHPILLPKYSALTRLLIDVHHQRTLHGGIKLSVASIRQRYWIPQIRQSVKTAIRECVKCRRAHGKPYTSPNHAPLPAVRTNEWIPFTVTGIDYTGGFTVKGPKGLPNADRTVYILLFTCATTRSIHLEVVEDMSVTSFLEALRCFTSHHSRPVILMSDNAKTFEAAAKMFQKLAVDPHINRSLADQGIEWRFIPKRAPWYGGMWERLVGITKRCLTPLLGRSKPTLSAFRAMVAEAELVLNDRPLEEPCSGINETDALCPSHLLYGRRLNVIPYDKEVAEGILDPSFNESPSQLKKSLNHHQRILHDFKKRFLKSYIPSLREYHQATKKTSPTEIKKRDVVLVHSDAPRRNWNLAIVEDLIVGADGKVRAANIKTANGKTNRPISKLYPVGVSDDVDFPACKATKSLISSNRPSRGAATKARDAIQKLFNEEDSD